MRSMVPEKCRLMGVRRRREGGGEEDHCKARCTSATETPHGVMLSVGDGCSLGLAAIIAALRNPPALIDNVLSPAQEDRAETE